MKHFLAVTAVVLAAPLSAQDSANPGPATTAAPTPPGLTQAAPPTPDPASTVSVTLTTASGPIVIAVETEKAPITATNFLKYVDGKRLDGTVFYRSVRVQPDFGFIQFGTSNDPKRTLPQIAHEPTTKTGLSHVDGAISMAMGAPGTARGDFFIIVGNTPSMDAADGNPGYAVFGRVIEGMDVVRRILDMPTSPTTGEGMMKGQMLEPTVAIKSARRVSIDSAGAAK